MELVHSSLVNAWEINNANEMCWIFDVTHPPRQFKRGVFFTGQEFATYGPAPYGDLTETDDGPKRLLQYAPRTHR